MSSPANSFCFRQVAGSPHANIRQKCSLCSSDSCINNLQCYKCKSISCIKCLSINTNTFSNLLKLSSNFSYQCDKCMKIDSESVEFLNPVLQKLDKLSEKFNSIFDKLETDLKIQ